MYVEKQDTGTDKNKAERFSTGFALVTIKGQTFFIDTLGKRVFDHIDQQHNDKLGSEHSIEEYESYRLQHPKAMPKPVIKVWKDGHTGLLSPKGEWLLPAEYNDIDVQFSDVWKVTKQGKESYYGNTGFMLPFFDEVGYLDGEHFDVREGAQWGIYNRITEKMVVPMQYDKFDYCGGCGRKPAYVYAQSKGKWGVIDFEGKVLVDFAYDHEHWGMRSDEWVHSFSKDGHRLLVHIPTRKEYPLANDAGYQFLPGSLLAYATNGKFGIIDKDGQPYLEPEYDDIRLPNQNNYLGYQGPYTLIVKAGKTGVLHNGKVLFQPEWDEVMVYDDFFVLTKDGKPSLWDAAKNELLPPTYSEITHIKDYFYSSGSKGISVFKIKEKALYGLYVPQTATVVKPAYHSVELVDWHEGEGAKVIECTRQGQKALYSMEGEELLPLRYNAWGRWYDSKDLLRVQLDDKWGLYDLRQGKEVIPCAYDHLGRLDKSSYVLTEVGDYGSRIKGIRNENGEVVLDDQYKNVEAVGDGWYLLAGDEGASAQLLNSQTGTVQRVEWKYVWNVNAPNLLLVSEDGQTGSLYNVAASNLLEGQYDVSYYADPYAEAGRSNNQHPSLFGFHRGIAVIRKNDKIGFVDSLGKQFIAPQYDAATPFTADGVAAVGKRQPGTDDWGQTVELMTYRFVNTSGETLSSTDYPAPTNYFSDFDFFLGSYQIIQQLSKKGRQYLLMGLEDTKGNIIIKPEYDAIEALNGGSYFLLQQGQRFGIADRSGHIILPVKFENMLINRYAVGEQLVFPLLCMQSSGWRYYTQEGKPITVEGMKDSDVFEINQSLW